MSVVFRIDSLAAVAIDGDGAGLGIDYPHGTAAGAQPVLHLGEHFARPILGRKDLDRQIGRAGKEPLRQSSANAIRAEKRHVGRADGIGIGRNHEARLGAQHCTQVLSLHEVEEKMSHPGGNRAVS